MDKHILKSCLALFLGPYTALPGSIFALYKPYIPDLYFDVIMAGSEGWGEGEVDCLYCFTCRNVPN